MTAIHGAAARIDTGPERLHQFAIHVGVVMIVIGMVALLFSADSHGRGLQRLRSGESLRLPLLPLSIVIGSFVALLCLYVVWWVLIS